MSKREPAIGVLVAFALGMAEFRCYCTLDEYLDGHRHHCPMHEICGDCIEDYQDKHCICCGVSLGQSPAIEWCDYCNYDLCLDLETGMSVHGGGG